MGIIVASLSQPAKVFSGQVYAIIVAMSLLTSILAPPILPAILGTGTTVAGGGPR